VVSTSFIFKTIYHNTALTEEQIEQQIAAGQVHFIMHGIDNSIPDEHCFQKKWY
jgi:hypothetical protein